MGHKYDKVLITPILKNENNIYCHIDNTFKLNTSTKIDSLLVKTYYELSTTKSMKKQSNLLN
jgi:hypothetical protein